MKRFSLRAFWHNRRGNVLILTGLGFLFLVGIGGAGYDLGRQQLVRQKIQQAADEAALAAAAMDGNESNATRTNTAQAFFALNYPQTYLGVARPTPSITIANDTITVRANTRVGTSFVGNFGVHSIAAAGSSTTRISSTTTRADMDLILVLDNSGSMAAPDAGGGQTRIAALKAAADQMVDGLLTTGGNARMGLVTWDSVVIESKGLDNNPATAKAFLGRMAPRGFTNSAEGLEKAKSLATNFRPNIARAVVLMTDGANNTPSQTASNARSLGLCNQIKNNGTLLYTIAFGSNVVNSAVIADFLGSCASGAPPQNQGVFFFVAPDGAALAAAFAAITTNLRKVQIVE